MSGHCSPTTARRCSPPSDDSASRRFTAGFFAPKRSFSEREINYFLKVDFVGHVALVAALSEGGRQVIVGGARCIVSHPGRAEVAFAIDDPRQKLGISTHLISDLIRIARAAGVEAFVADSPGP